MTRSLVQLADNTNQWGPAPAASAAIASFAAGVNEYPSLYGERLKSAAARYLSVDPAEVVTGCGSDDVLASAVRAYSENGDVIAWCAPTFVMMPALAHLQRLRTVESSFSIDGDIDVDALLASSARIIYVCTPNNPTGTLASEARIARLAQETDALLIVDEAYAEFSGTSLVPLAMRHERVLVARTLSKAFGLAGLRAGYGIANREVVRRLERARGPYTLNRIAEQAGAVALEKDVEWMRARALEASTTRERLAEELRRLGYVPLPSAANFLCVPVADASAFTVALRERGILVRAFRQLPGIGDAVRISVAPWPRMARLVEALEWLRVGARA